MNTDILTATFHDKIINKIHTALLLIDRINTKAPNKEEACSLLQEAITMLKQEKDENVEKDYEEIPNNELIYWKQVDNLESSLKCAGSFITAILPYLAGNNLRQAKETLEVIKGACDFED